MGCKGPNDVVTMVAQNNLCELRGSGGQKQKLEVQGLVQGPGCTRRYLTTLHAPGDGSLTQGPLQAVLILLTYL